MEKETFWGGQWVGIWGVEGLNYQYLIIIVVNMRLPSLSQRLGLELQLIHAILNIVIPILKRAF